MGEIRIVGPGKTRGYPYPVCKKTRVDCMSILYTRKDNNIFPLLFLFFNPIALKGQNSVLTLLHSEQPTLHFNPTALRTAKTPYSFGHSECNKVK